MVGNGFLIQILQILLITTNHCLFLSIICERLNEVKSETKVEIEITYQHRYFDDKPYLLQQKNVFKIVQFIYNIPNFSKSSNPDIRGNNRASSSNNGANLRHGFRFSSLEKSPSAFTLSSQDSEPVESGSRTRNYYVTGGQLIHVVSLSEKQGDNSSGLYVSHTACHETVNSVPYYWIALIQGGSCSADRKLRHIMKMSNHPTTVLIYGNSRVPVKQESYLSFNQDDSPTVIFLPWNSINGIVQRCYNSSGEITIPPELLSKMNKSSLDLPINNQNYCNVTIKIFTSADDNFLNKTSVLFVSISFILLMVISLAWLMFYYVQRFRYIHTKEQFSRRLAHMAKKAVAKIPVKTLKQGDRETDPDLDNCAICIECYKPSDTVRILPCKHYFHKSCIDPWLLEQRSCPMCKLNILHAYGFLANERGSIISEDRLSELDSSLEVQFMAGNIGPPLPATTSTRVQAYCQARDNNYVNVATLPAIFTEQGCRSSNRWSSLLLKMPQRVSHRIDRSVSLRHLSGSAEERITFLSHNRLLSHSATDTTATIQDPKAPHLPTLLWQLNSTSSAYAANAPGSQSTISSH